MSWHCFKERQHTAAKLHTCFLCGGTILPRDKYLRREGAESREFVTMKMHLGCAQETEDWDDMDWETFEPGSLRYLKGD
jgi:hypothetical protein